MSWYSSPTPAPLPPVPAPRTPWPGQSTAPPAPGAHPPPESRPWPPPQASAPAIAAGVPAPVEVTAGTLNGHPGPPPHPRPGWLGAVALASAFLLAVVAGVQAYQIDRLGGLLAETERRLAQAQSGDDARLDGLEQRAAELERRAGTVFNPEAIAAAVLPSVFRVRAGGFTGTAFAVGPQTSDGGTNLFTNYHVVESVWDSGARQVLLERTDQRFPAVIVRVDEANDIAHLRTTTAFTGLVTAPKAVRPGQQIVVVGAPLGLTDSVTTGVVSALRPAERGSGSVIQFDAPINPGNSGGPVINGSKQVVGIATAKARDAEGIGLAVPISTACDGFQIC